MLKKLLKYDLKYMYKFLSVFYALTIFFSITTRILFSLKQTTVIYIIGQVSVGCLFAMIANVLINTIMRVWVRYKETLYGDESYLTHTLPVTKKELYLSKLISTMCYVLTSFTVIVLGLFIAYYTKKRLYLLKAFLASSLGMFDLKTGYFLTCLIVILFLELLSCLQSGFIGLTLGHRKESNKIIWSLVYGFIAYTISQMCLLIVIFAIALFNPNVMELFKSNVIPSTGILNTIIILSIVLYTFVNAVYMFISIKLLNQGVNVE